MTILDELVVWQTRQHSCLVLSSYGCGCYVNENCKLGALLLSGGRRVGFESFKHRNMYGKLPGPEVWGQQVKLKTFTPWNKSTCQWCLENYNVAQREKELILNGFRSEVFNLQLHIIMSPLTVCAKQVWSRRLVMMDKRLDMLTSLQN